MNKRGFGYLVLLLGCAFVSEDAFTMDSRAMAEEVESKVIAWYQDLHAHPELLMEEHRTAGTVAKHLRSLAIETRTGIGNTGVVGLLRGDGPGPVVALRADMDALPVTETTDLPFASKARAVYRGEEVGVMHACGHDAHTAILMGAAEALASIRSELRGTVLFVFQPAEEAALPGEKSGAEAMLEEGLFEVARPEAIFALHTSPGLHAGQFATREGPLMASEDNIVITIRGVQTHASRPWDGIDPITIAGQMVSTVQTIVSRQVNLASAPTVISFGSIHGGVHANIIPDEVVLQGTIRAFDQEMRRDIQARLRRTVRSVAESYGTTAELSIRPVNPVTINDPDLVKRMRPSLEAVAGAENVYESELILGTEDFANYALQVPGMYFMMGVTGPSRDPREAAPNHSPYFQVDEEAFVPGIQAMIQLTLDFLDR